MFCGSSGKSCDLWSEAHLLRRWSTVIGLSLKLCLVPHVTPAWAKGSLHSAHRKLTPHSPLPPPHPSFCQMAEDAKVLHTLNPCIAQIRILAIGKWPW